MIKDSEVLELLIWGAKYYEGKRNLSALGHPNYSFYRMCVLVTWKYMMDHYRVHPIETDRLRRLIAAMQAEEAIDEILYD